MNVQGIFKLLIISVVCIIVGAIVINVIAPNVMTQMCNAMETQIYKATSVKLDFNGDGSGSDASNTKQSASDNAKYGTTGGSVDGFEGTDASAAKSAAKS